MSVTRTTVEGSFDQIAELSVEEYIFTNVGKRENAGRVLFGRNVPLTGNSFLLTYSGVVKAGVEDFEAVEVRIDDEAATIDVTVPRVKVTSSEIDPDSITVYDQSMNPFNQIEMQDFSNFIAEEKRVAEQKAVEAGLLERAEDRVKMLMVSHVEALTGGTQQDGYAVKVGWK
ncbi:hypothetical protein CCYS_09905 [Corynebacterium cystitidis DSM 20524]|uniref:DUF4230 domain-containing protein n=1 Tax=Corynebacterium cystitidis DSM 20524 TaxID=1121357 RepID=A0A1H9VN61_9CORY|nr:hypothetical protein CCYS_09905 [Corynebacterium cystitidis DSM 20524]SES22981.1 Protein of unknown function [Corynebacterium cystitidis DSM 20524]SNV69344.1 Uncharacterised protein [Corynebacterium cystitidis]